VGVRIRQPIHRSLRSLFELTLTGEYRESETFLLGEPFSFSPGPDDGKSKVTVIRFAQDWVYRDLRQVVAARSTVSLGIDALGSTVNGGKIPDSQFLAWLGQFQYARRFDPLWGTELLFRTDVQLSSSPLLSLEQFAVGGAYTVRGYRENLLVRDNGLVSSLEVRIPLWKDEAGRPVLQLAPFADIGRSWNTDRPEAAPRTIYSVGVGLRFQFTRHLFGNVYWGHALRDVFTPEDRDLQDSGVHFSVVLAY
jgi:hemolysin activation/secretion protein